MTHIFEVALYFLVVVKDLQKRLVDVRTTLITTLRMSHTHTNIIHMSFVSIPCRFPKADTCIIYCREPRQTGKFEKKKIKK